MAITRNALQFEKNFTQIPNAWIRDKTLTRKSRGLLAEILSHRVGWTISVASLQSAGVEGRDSIRSAIAELEDAGYLERIQTRDGGRFAEIDYRLVDPTDVGLSDDGKTDVGGSPTKNTISKKTNHQKTKSLKLAKRAQVIHSTELLASERQLSFLRDCYITLYQTEPLPADLALWPTLTRKEIHEELRTYWQEIEHGQAHQNLSPTTLQESRELLSDEAIEYHERMVS